MKMKDIKKGIALVTALSICLSVASCKKEESSVNVNTLAISTIYNNDFEVSNLPEISMKEALDIKFNPRITYHDIVKILEDINKDKDTSIDKYLKVLKVEEAYNDYLVARQEENISEVRKTLGEFQERIHKAHILSVLEKTPEKIINVSIDNDVWNQTTRSGQYYKAQYITITYKPEQKTTIKPGGIIIEEEKDNTEKYALSLSREWLKNIKKLKKGLGYSIDEIDKEMEETLMDLCLDANINHFQPTPWGEKNFCYLELKTNEEVYKKVKSLSNVLKQKEISKIANKKDQLLQLKKQAMNIKTAMNNQNTSTKSISKSIPRRV